MEQPQTIRVFVSSTFVDLFDEREYLAKIVFPEIRHRCRDRGIVFTEIDLRWGITREDSSFGRVISTCLQEIDRCRPFFIGIVGDRYGWVPDYRDIHKSAYLLEEHAWLEESVLDGESLVEMEFNHAVLNSEVPMPASFFYVRDPREANEEIQFGIDARDGAQLGEANAAKLKKLRDRIGRSGKPVHQFKTPEELGAFVRDDLLSAIERLWPEESQLSPLDVTRREHESFSLSRRQAYIADFQTLEALTDHVLSDAQPLVVHGPSGSGKSALLAYWSRFFLKRHSEYAVVTHFVGSVATDTGHEGLLQRILLEARELLGVDEPIPVSAPEMEQELTRWLARVPEKKLVLVIDAVNQLESRAAELGWLPFYIPPNVRVIISTTPGSSLDALRERQWPELAIKPLSIEDREALVTRFLSEYRKSLTLDQCHQIAHSELSSSPLFLRTLLEELRLSGNFEALDERIQYYLSSTDTGDLFRRVLERIESDFGRETICEIMTLIWSSRQGLTEHELLELTSLTRAQLSQILIALEYHLLRRQGLIGFFHDYFRQAVERHYLRDAADQRQVHERLAAYFAMERVSERSNFELPWQLRLAEDHEGLRNWLTNIPGLLEYCTEDTQWDYLGYWLSLKGKFDIATSYREALDEYAMICKSTIEYALALEHTGKFLMACGEYEAAKPLLQEALPIIEITYGDDSPEIANFLNIFGNLLQMKGELSAAVPLLERALSIHDRSGNGDSESLSRSLDGLSTVLYFLGQPAEAEPLIQRAVEINQRLLGPSHSQTIQSLEDFGAVLLQLGRYEEAEAVWTTALAAARTVGSIHHPNYASLLSNLAAIARHKGNLHDASSLLQESLEISERSIGPDHPDTASIVQNLGVLLKLEGELATAEPLYRRALATNIRVRGPRHPATAKSRVNLGRLLVERGDFARAEQLFCETQDIFTGISAEDQAYSAMCGLCLADLYRRQEKFRESVSTFAKYRHHIDDTVRRSQRERDADYKSFWMAIVASGEQANYGDVKEIYSQIAQAEESSAA